MTPDWRSDLPVGTSGHRPPRVYATFDLSGLTGATVTSAGLYAQAASQADCTKSAAEIWRTATPTGKISWHKAPAEIEKIGPFNLGLTCTGYVQADIGAAIAAAVTAGQKSLSIEIRVPAAHEADPAYGWTMYGYYNLHLSAGLELG